MNVVLNLVFIAFISVQHGAVRVGPPLEKPSDSCGQAEEQQLDVLLADLLEGPGDQLVVSEGAIHSVKVASQGTLDGHFSANPSAQSSAAAELPQWMMNDLSDMAAIRSPHESDYQPTEAWGSPQALKDVLEDQSEVAAAADHMEDCRPALAEAEPVTPSPSKRRISNNKNSPASLLKRPAAAKPSLKKRPAAAKNFKREAELMAAAGIEVKDYDIKKTTRKIPKWGRLEQVDDLTFHIWR